MEMNLYLLLALLIALLVIAYLLAKLHRVRGQLSLIKDALTDIKNGNLNRRVLARKSDLTKQICYDINEIAMSSQSRLIQQKQSEQVIENTGVGGGVNPCHVFCFRYLYLVGKVVVFQ